MRKNGPYIILEAIRVDSKTEYVLAVNELTGGFVTWCCTNSNDYFWGHYFNSSNAARINLFERVIEALNGLEGE